MPRIARARPVSYVFDKTGTIRPLVAELKDVTCADTLPTFMQQRHTTYESNGTPITAYAWDCCTGECTDAEISGGTCYELADGSTWPLGPNYPTQGGITKRMGVFFADDNSCLSANQLAGELVWDAVSSSWKGSFTLRNCTLSLAVTVAPPPATFDDPAKFTLTWSGTTGDSGSVSAGCTSGCCDPILVNFGIISLPFCCQCPGSGAGTTDTGATVNIWVTANCRTVRVGRHIDYYYDSTGTPTPVVAKPKNCPWDKVDPDGCGIMTCPLNAHITSTACSCLAGDWVMDYASGIWSNINVGTGCAAPATVRLTCSAAGTDANGNTLVLLQCDVICGVTNTGSATLTILASDLENLDETFTITMGDTTPPDPSACCAAGSTVTVRVTRV